MLQKKSEKLLNWHKEADLATVKEALLHDAILISSTDTIPGFLAPLSENAFLALNKIKGDRSDKPYLVLINSWDKLSFFIQTETITPEISDLINSSWNAAVTFIFKARHDLPSFLRSSDMTIAIRRPQHLGLLTLLASYNGLFSTSANKSGQPAPTSYAELNPDLVEQVKYLLFDDINQTPISNKPSTILDISQAHEGIIYVLREGTYTLQQLERCYDFSFKKRS